MPAESLDEQGLEKNPNLDLAQIRFLLLKGNKNDDKLKNELLEKIKGDSEWFTQ